VIAAPYCLHCGDRIDSDEAIFVAVDGPPPAGPRAGEISWVCPRPECLERLTAAAEEEECLLLRPQGIFDHGPRPNGLPAWVVWISKRRAREEAESSGLFEAIYRPFTLTAR
jgi:hypothetical protein